MRGAAGQGEETASINAQGFGGRDFQPRKPPEVFRIVCLGESSTFGFHNPDDGTYPALLQQLLQAGDGEHRVEVINASFPYYNAGSVLSLLKARVLGWQPDVITLYAAFNDAGWPLEVGPTLRALLLRALLWMQQHSLTYYVVKEHLLPDRRAMAIARWIGRRLPGRVDEAAVERHIDRVALRYRRNVNEIVRLAQAAGAAVILARQPMRLGRRRDRTYEEEYQAVLAKLRRGHRLSSGELMLLTHHRLIEELDAIRREHGLRVVDNIALADAHGDAVASYVHLTVMGNLRLAGALRDAIQPVLAATPRAASAPATVGAIRPAPTGPDPYP